MGDKEWIQKEYLPKLKGKILYVGVMTKDDYCKYTQTPETFETMDIDINVKKGISPYKHHICDFLDFKNEYKYDHISLHGLWGENVYFMNKGKENPTESRLEATKTIISIIDKANDMLNVEGTLQIGPNTELLDINGVYKTFMDDIYNYLEDNIYQQIYRNRPKILGNINYIFWGKKKKNKKFDYKNNNLWEIIKTVGLFKL
tara:strand:- start:717 stop:1322 length:606 start_codon:yes stop_codon:yes gene_type:complete